MKIGKYNIPHFHYEGKTDIMFSIYRKKAWTKIQHPFITKKREVRLYRNLFNILIKLMNNP